MRIYDARDSTCMGLALGAVFPAVDACEVQEDAGGEYVLRMTVPIVQGSGWELLAIDRQIVAPCPVLDAVKDQIFRIHALSLTDSGHAYALQARHISYDMQYVTMGPVAETDGKITAEEAAAKLWGSITGETHGFSLQADVETELRIGWGKISVTRALLDSSGGLVRAARARLVRDNRTIRLMPSDGLDSGVTIRSGVDLMGLTVDGDATETYTRLIPTGQDDKGDVVMLPEVYIDCPGVEQYAIPREYTWQVAGARVGTKKTLEDGSTKELTLEDVYGLLRYAANEKIAAGCDIPPIQSTVEYIDLGRTQQHPELEGLQEVRLYEQVAVEHPSIGLTIKKPVRGYIWDPIRLRYTQLVLGDPFEDTSKDTFVTSAQRNSDHSAYTSNSQRVETILQDHKTFILDQTSYNNSVLIELDALSGRIDLYASSEQIGELKQMVNTAMVEIDAMNARIDLKAESTTVDALGARLSSAEVAIDGLNADIELKASQTEVNKLAETLNQALIDIDGANARIDAKAESTVVDALGERVTSAELALDGKAGTAELKTLRDDTSAAVAQLRADLDSAEASISARFGENEASIKALSDSLGSYVTIDALETRVTGFLTVDDGAKVAGALNAQDVACGSLTTGPIDCGYVDASRIDCSGALTAGSASIAALTVNGSGAVWKEQYVVTSVSLKQSVIDVNTGSNTYRVLSAGTTISYNGTTIKYLGA